MRILWIVHDVFECFLPYVKGNPTKGGSWIAPLFYGIKDYPEVVLGSIVPIIGGEAQKKEIGGVTYYSIEIKRGENSKDMSDDLAS